MFSFQTYKTTHLPSEKQCLPLHLACNHGHLCVVKYFIDELKCEPTIPGEFGKTPLHYACHGGQLNIVQYLVAEKGCDLKVRYSCSNSPIADACDHGRLNIIKYFTALQNFNPNDLLDYGGTLLHFAAFCCNNNADVIQYLINECGCQETLDEYGILPVHWSCIWGHLNAIKCFINEQNCNGPSCRDFIGRTPLHHACAGGHVNIIDYLVTELGCDPRIADETDTLPIHIACQAGHLDVLKYFITKQNSDRIVRGRNGWTPLHYATAGGHMNIIEYLIKELKCDPLIADDNSTTILQVATSNDHIKIVEWLLHKGWFSTQDIDKAGETCIDVVRHTRNRYKLLKLFRPLTKIVKTFEIHTFSKVILIGNSSAGKSTLAKVISERATTYFNFFRFGNVLKVETNTAGIIPACIKSWEIGKIILYDLAGQAEYHSSHSALMEFTMQQFPATFVLVLDLSDKDTLIIQKLHYWLNFFDNATSRSDDKSCLIVIGSHADLLSKGRIKLSIVCNTILDNLKQMPSAKRYISVFVHAMDCRKINSSGTHKFVQLLCKSHETIFNRAPKMSYFCHLLYAFLQYEQIVVCTLKELAAFLAEDDDCPIPLEFSFLTELLVTLHNKGIVVFLKNMEESWIVADMDVLLKDINMILFASKEFKEHYEVSSSTGIVRSSSLQQLLPQYNLQMLVSFLKLLEICHCVDLSGITTNLQQIGVSSLDDNHHESLLFFPCLLEIQRSSVLLPSEKDMFSNWFGWCLSCKHQKYCFFTSRFLHVLLLRLIGTFPLADSDVTASAHRQQKRCTVWTNGVSWDNEEGIRTVVEIIDQNQRVVVVMSHTTESRPLKCSKHRSAVIRLIRDLKEELFPKLDVSEYLISPDLLKNWPSKDACLPDKGLCPMENVANSMLLHNPWILSLKGRLGLKTKNTLLNESYYQISPILCV